MDCRKTAVYKFTFNSEGWSIAFAGGNSKRLSRGSFFVYCAREAQRIVMVHLVFDRLFVVALPAMSANFGWDASGGWFLIKALRFALIPSWSIMVVEEGRRRREPFSFHRQGSKFFSTHLHDQGKGSFCEKMSMAQGNYLQWNVKIEEIIRCALV